MSGEVPSFKRERHGNVERVIGQGYLNLQALIRDGKDAASASVALQGKSGPTGTLVVSLAAVDAMRAASGQPAAASVAAASSSVRVDVGALSLAPAVKRDVDVAEVWVEVDLLGLAEASQLRTKRLHKSATNLDFGFSTSVAVGAGSEQQEVLRRAVTSKEEKDANVSFVLKTLTADVTLGVRQHPEPVPPVAMCGLCTRCAAISKL